MSVRSQWGPLVECLNWFLLIARNPTGKPCYAHPAAFRVCQELKDTKVNIFICLSYQVDMAVCRTKKLIDIFIFDVLIVLNWVDLICPGIAAQLCPAIHPNLKRHLQTVVW